jgi:CheY-like chemotaxis protein
MPFTPLSQVLSVDDNEDAAEILSLLMKSHQVEVTSARSSAEALLKIKSNPFDLYLLDGWMPGLDGFELCRLIRESDSTTPILFYSGAAYETDKQRALVAGASAYVTKPDVDGLIETMLELIAKARVDNAQLLWVGNSMSATETRFASQFFNAETVSD